MSRAFEELVREVGACRICAATMPHTPRPVVRLAPTSRVLIIGQAPGSKVHASGVPWQDDSGDRLRDWLGVDDATFDDPACFGILPMGLCYPGRGAGADLPPRPECAPAWHERLRAHLTDVRLTLLIGTHAQVAYLEGPRRTMTAAVREADTLKATVLPLPHPSWRVVGWMRRNPWFGDDVVPRLRTRVTDALADGPPAGPPRQR